MMLGTAFITSPIDIDHAGIVHALSHSAQGYLRRVRDNYRADGGVGSVGTSLDVTIVGGGICGLSAAVALRNAGHTVRVYESADITTTIGAGIQLAPNATRQLQRWGLGPYLERNCVHPTNFITKRWEDGEPIGLFRTMRLARAVGSPYIQIHRHALLIGLYELALLQGVEIFTKSKVVAYNHEESFLALDSGRRVSADVVIAADGVRSLARQSIEGHKISGTATRVACRATIATAAIKAEREIAWMADRPDQYRWAGPDRHCQAYGIQSEDTFNLVFVVPFDQARDPSKHKDELMAHFSSWDPDLLKLLSLVDGTKISKWPLWAIPLPERWTLDQSRITLLGDAAHDMLPFLGQGAAMGIEDAACLEPLLSVVRGSTPAERHTDIVAALEILHAFRSPRVERIRQQAEESVSTLHLGDGTKQRIRDRMASAELTGEELSHSPYIFTNTRGQNWLYNYNVIDAVLGLNLS